MRWFFSRRPPHPLDAAQLRPALAQILSGDRSQAARAVEQARAARGADPAVRYLECLLYLESDQSDPERLLEHLRPALPGRDAPPFPEARLLEARLLASLGRIDQAAALVEALGRDKLSPALQAEVQATAAALRPWRGEAGQERVRQEAETLAAELARQGLTLRWSLSDLARLDSQLDGSDGGQAPDRSAWTSLVGEIVRRARGGRWRLSPAPETRVVAAEGFAFEVGRALAARLDRGIGLYDAFHRAAQTPRQALPGVATAQAVVEAGIHPAVVIDHAARALAAAGASGIGVLRERPTPEGPVVLPLSYIDKGGLHRAIYVETRPWSPERVNELRRWVGRVRASSARDAQLDLLSAEEPPPMALELLSGPPGAPIPGLPSVPAPGARSATPRSLDEPRLRWIDERAEVTEALVRSAMGSADLDDLALVRRIEQGVRTTLRGAPETLGNKHWTALYGYGALYGRVLSRSFGGRWRALDADQPPASWEMLMPWGQVVRPFAEVLDPATAQNQAGPGLVDRFLEVRGAWEATHS